MRDLDKLRPLLRDSRARLHLHEGLETYCRVCEADEKKSDCDKCSLLKWKTMQDDHSPLDTELFFRDLFSRCYKCSGTSYPLCIHRNCGLFRAMRLAIAYAHGHTTQ